jgi:hypothetical protein
MMKWNPKAKESQMAKRTLILLMLVLTGCSTEYSLTAISTIAPTTTVRPLTTFTHALTVTPSPLATISSEVMRYQCLEIAESLPSDRSLKGVIAYNGENNLSAYLQNQETNGTYIFPREEGDRLLAFDVSSDGKWIMYDHYSERTKEDRLVIATANGKPVQSDVADPQFLWNWFDNQRLIHLKFLEDGTPTLQLFNPFTGEHQDLQADFPDSQMFTSNTGFPSYPNWNFSKGGSPVYDPTLTRVVYPGTAIEKNEEWPIIIWDAQAGQAVAQFVTKDYWGETPLWTPDGKQFIFATKLNSKDTFPPANEFLAISRDGEAKQLTHFTDYFEKTSITNNYSMSPDGKLLAFWILAKPSVFEKAQLAVLNIETGKVTNYCIKGDSFLDVDAYQESLPTPIWSPDSTQLLVISRLPENPQLRRLVMVDIVNNYAAQINQDMEPVGWMVTP